jgi:cytochrome c biogenesis protein CcdA
MIDAPIALAFGAGMLATVNPCGFAMLPAYLSYFLGLDDPSTSATTGVARALKVGAVVSFGFMLVFGLIGWIIHATGTSSIQERVPWLTIVIGLALVALGIAMLRGYTPSFKLPMLNKGGDSRELGSMFLFGVSYATVSISCTIPVFISLVITSFTTRGVASGVSLFVAYGLGMATLMMALTLSLAMARKSLVGKLRSALPYVNRVAGVLLILTGGYVAYYGWYEVQILSGNDRGGGPVEKALEWQSSITNWINSVGTTRLGLIFAAVVGVAALVAFGWRGRTRRTRT